MIKQITKKTKQRYSSLCITKYMKVLRLLLTLGGEGRGLEGELFFFLSASINIMTCPGVVIPLALYKHKTAVVC